MGASAKAVGLIDSNARKATSSLGSLGKLAVGGGLGYLGARGLTTAATAGFRYNKMINGQRIAFETLLGSQKAAADFMAQIQQLALDSPVLDPQTTGDAARLLMAYGIAAKDTLPFVKALGDMSAATGKDLSETLPRGAMAIGQIGSKGKLQAEELNQLAESVGLSRDAIRKELHMTKKDFAAAFTPGNNIDASVALPAIRRAMQKVAGGAADALSKTPQGQFARAQEVGSKIMGQITQGIYAAAGKTAGQLGDAIQPIWQKEVPAAFGGSMVQKTVGDKLEESITAAKPIVGQAIDDLKLGDKFRDTMSYAGSHAPGWFWEGFKGAGTTGQVITVAFLAKKLGLTSGALALLRGLAGGSFGGKGGGAGGVLGSLKPVPVYVVSGPGLTPGGKGGKVGRGGRIVAGARKAGALGPQAAVVAGTAYGTYEIVTDPNNGKVLRNVAKTPAGYSGRFPGAARNARGAGGYGVEDPLPGSSTIFPRARVAPTRSGRGKVAQIPITITLDKRKVGQGLATVTADDILGG